MEGDRNKKRRFLASLKTVINYSKTDSRGAELKPRAESRYFNVSTVLFSEFIGESKLRYVSSI
jgi:hypothetical protein